MRGGLTPDVRVVDGIRYVNHEIVHYLIDGVDVVVKQSYPRWFSVSPSTIMLIAGADPTNEDKTRFQDILSANYPLTDWGWNGSWEECEA